MNTRISIDKITVILSSSCSTDKLVIDALKVDKFLANERCHCEIFKVDKTKTVKPFTYLYHCELWDAVNTKMILNFFRRDLSGKIMPWCEFTFNPNKHYDDFPKVLRMLDWLGFRRIKEISRIDIAVDFPVSPNDIEILCTRPITVVQNTGDNFTRYKRYSDGTLFRIYNKAAEEGIIGGNITRCELVLKNWISNKLYNYNTISSHFDDIYIRDIEVRPNLPHHITYALQNIPSCKLRDYIPLLAPKQRDEAQRYYQARYKRYNFTIDDYFYICKLLQLYLPMLKEREV